MAEAPASATSVDIPLPAALVGKQLSPKVRSAVALGALDDGTPVYLVSNPAEPEALAAGKVTVQVRRKTDEIRAGSKEEFMGGSALKDVDVECVYEAQGQPEREWAKTDDKGRFTFAVPLGVKVTVTARGESKTVTCTPEKPTQHVVFGHVGIMESDVPVAGG